MSRSDPFWVMMGDCGGAHDYPDEEWVRYDPEPYPPKKLEFYHSKNKDLMCYELYTVCDTDLARPNFVSCHEVREIHKFMWSVKVEDAKYKLEKEKFLSLYNRVFSTQK